jgi:hypothetical protein
MATVIFFLVLADSGRKSSRFFFQDTQMLCCHLSFLPKEADWLSVTRLQPHDSSGALASGLFLSGVRSIHAPRFQFVDHDFHFEGTQSHPTMSKLSKLSKLGMRPYCTFLQQQVAT